MQRNEALINVLRRLFELEIFTGQPISKVAASAKIACDFLTGMLKKRSDYMGKFYWSRKYYRLHMDEVITMAEHIIGAELGPLRGRSGATKSMNTAQFEGNGATSGPSRGQQGAISESEIKVSPTTPSKQNPPSKRKTPLKGVKKKNSSPQSVKMKKPTLEELGAEFERRAGKKTWAGLEFVPADEAQAFLDYWNGCGWKIGKSLKPMVSWQSAISTWLKTLRRDQANGRHKKHSDNVQSYQRINGVTSKFFGNPGQA